MEAKQINLSMPVNLLQTSTKIVNKNGYRNVQEWILELIRKEIKEQEKRELDQIIRDMDNGKGKHFKNKDDFMKFLRELK